MKRSVPTLRIPAVDKKNMLELLKTFPEQCQEAIGIGTKYEIPEKYKKQYKNIVFLGLGGSAIGGDVIKSYLIDESPLPIQVVRDYSVPSFISSESLVFASSYSGDTEETLSMYKSAKAKSANIICITSGGRLKRLAGANGDLAVIIPGGLPPRASLGYSFIPALIMLYRLGIVSDKSKDIFEAITLMKDMLKKEVGPDARKNRAMEIAAYIFGKIPVVYAPAKNFDVVATRWRGQINENAKTLSSCHVYPEMNHNEIVGWVYPRKVLKDLAILTLRDKGEHPRVATRIKITTGILKDSGFKSMDIGSKGQSLLARMMSLVYLGDFVSFYLAVLNGVDPTPVERISFLKKQLGKK